MSEEQIKVTTAVDNTGFTTGLESMKAESEKFGDSVKEEFGGIFDKISGIGVAAAAAFIAAFEMVKDAIGEAIENAVKFANASERFGIGTTQLQQLTNAAQQHGATMEDVTSAYNKLLINSQGAIEGNREMIDSFAALGVSVDDLKSKSLDEVMNQIADGTANATDKGAAYDSIVKVLGKSAGNLFDTLKLGSEQIKAVGDASGVMSEFTIRSLDNMEKASKGFWGQFTAWAGDAFVSAIVGAQTLYIAVQSYIQGMTEAAVAFGELIVDVFTFKKVNLSDFKERLINAFTDAVGSAQDRIQKLTHPDAGDSDDKSVRSARAGEDKGGNEAVKKAEKEKEEIARINKEADEKEAQAKYDSLSLDQKIAEQKKIIYQKSTWFGSGNELEEAKARLAIAVAHETLDKLEKEKAEADKRELEKNKKKEEEKAKQAESIAAKKLSKEEEQLKKLEALDKKEKPDFDSLRKIGGGLAGVNYNVNTGQTALEKQIDYLKQQIDLQKQEVALLNTIANPDSSDDGSYIVG